MRLTFCAIKGRIPHRKDRPNFMLDDQKLTIELGKRIQRYRRMQVPLMSQERLASLLGLTRTSVTNIERGKQKMTLDTVYKLCEAFDVPLNEFLPPLSDVLAD